MLMKRTAKWEMQIFIWFQGDFRIIFYTGDMDLVCPPLQVAFGARRVADDNGMRVSIRNTGISAASMPSFSHLITLRRSKSNDYKTLIKTYFLPFSGYQSTRLDIPGRLWRSENKLCDELTFAFGKKSFSIFLSQLWMIRWLKKGRDIYNFFTRLLFYSSSSTTSFLLKQRQQSTTPRLFQERSISLHHP